MNRRLSTSLAFALLPIATGMLLAMPAVGAKPKPHPKPDLVVTRAKVLGNEYAYAGETVEIRVSDVVENEGKGKAANSVNELTISHKGAGKLKDLTRKVPPLKKGERSAGVGTAKIAIPADAKLGKYEAFLCADARGEVKEKNELDNCESAGAFYIAKRSWTGSFDGNYSDENGVDEAWSANGATFKSPGYQGSGLFTYGVLQASVAYQDAGTGTCGVYTGAGVDTAPIAYMAVNYQLGTYVATVSPNPGFDYPILCGGSVYTSGAPLSGAALEIGLPSGQGRALPFGTDRLAGSQAGVLNPSLNFSWNLK